MIKKFLFSTITFFLFILSSNAQSISMIGDAVSGWSTDVVMTSTDNVNFTLSNFIFTNGSAKFRQDAKWDNNWGSNAFPNGTGSKNGTNIPVTSGTYNVAFNINTGAYSFVSVVHYDEISISGTAGPGLNSDVSMITGDGINYSLNQYTLKSGTLVFRKDNSSTTSWKSASFPTGTATQGGSEIVVSPGTYDITFNKSTGAYSFTFATIGIIGSATAGGWNTDSLMSTTDGVNYAADGIVLTAGALKFRKNKGWTVAWGSSAFPTGTATLTGGDIKVLAGTYSISFNTLTGAFNFISGYPVVSLSTSGGTDVNLFTTDGEKYFLNNYSISAGNYTFRQAGTTVKIWGTSSFPSGTATLGGSSIPVLAGDYNIIFNKLTGVFSFNYLTVSVIGNATPGNWSTDTNLTTLDGVNYKLSGLALTLGELKFRQGNDWDVNWGANSFPGGSANKGGSNINVTTASNYTVTFNRSTGAFYFYDEVNLRMTSPLNLCKGSAASSLSKSVFAVPTSVLKWYTTASGGRASLTAPAPTTSTLGTKVYYVSQTIGNSEGTRVAMTVNVVDLPSELVVPITGTAKVANTEVYQAATIAVGAYVGTETTVSYRIPEFKTGLSYYWTVPAGVSIVGQANGVTTITQEGINANILNVNFKNVSSGIGSVGAITVQAQNSSGCKQTTKSTVALTKALPAAPATIVLTDGVSTTAVTNISKYIGTSTSFTVTAATSATANSYVWELPSTVTKVSGGTTNVITVNFAGVQIGTTSLIIGVKAVNGVGSSVSVNTGANAASTAKLLTLTSSVPAAVSTVTGTIASICKGSKLSYTITASPLATSYVITGPVGSVVTSASNLSNNSNVLTTSDLIFAVKYASVVPAVKTITIAAKNGLGLSATNKTLTLTFSTSTTCIPTGNKEAAAKVVTSNTSFRVSHSSASDLNMEVMASEAAVVEYAIYSFEGNLVATKRVQLNKGENNFSENIAALKKGFYIVRIVNPNSNEVIIKKFNKE